MTTTWIVLADEGRARVLEARDSGADPKPVEQLSDAGAHAHNADFRHDAYGRRAAGTAAANQTESAGQEKLEHEAELFARRVAELLDKAGQAGRFDELRIAAAPKFLGRLRQHLGNEVKKRVVQELDKDLLQLDDRSAMQRFFPPSRENAA